MAKTETPRRGLSGLLNDALGVVAPRLALQREAAMVKRQLLTREASAYQGAGRSPRGADFSRNTADATEAMRADRARMSYIGRDMLRNNPRVVRIRRQLVGNVVGAGIQPAIRWKGENKDDPRRKTLERLINKHCRSTDWDADGLRSMLGQQGQAFGTTVIDGEILLRRRFRRPGDGLALNFQVQALEADYLNRDIDGDLANGNYAVEGIEFNRIGKRVAYHLFREHPGSRRGGGYPATVRVDAANIIHLFDPVRPGQQRGVTWLAPVITLLHELQKYQDGQVKRQEIAALFAAFLHTDDDDLVAQQSQFDGLQAGAMVAIKSGEELTFTEPPQVSGYSEFMAATDRVIAAGMGITYQALTGDYTRVNYTSGRMGRMDVDPNIRDWQQNLMIAVVCARFGEWLAEAIEDVADIPRALWDIHWTPPVRPVVDPTKDYAADEKAMRSGRKSRRQVIRESGENPDAVEAEILEERRWEEGNDIVFTSNAGADASQMAANDETAANHDDERNQNGGQSDGE